MPNKGFIPDGEGEFNPWQVNFVARIVATPAAAAALITPVPTSIIHQASKWAPGWLLYRACFKLAVSPYRVNSANLAGL